MSQPDPRQTLSFMASEMAAISHRLTELSAYLREQAEQPGPAETAETTYAVGPTPAQPASPQPASSEPAPGQEVRGPAPTPSQTPVSGPAPSPAWSPGAAGAANTAAGQQYWRGPAEIPPDQAPPGAPRTPSPAKWEPSRVLAWVGSAVTLLGIVFLLILAAQRGWLGPEMRIGLGAVLGLVLVGLGVWSHRRPGGKAGGYALAATGFAALYLDVVASTSLYYYLPETVGLGVGLVVALAGLLLADRWGAQGFAVAMVVGCALCAPLITGAPDAQLIAFLLLLQIAAAPSQLRHDWRGLAVAAAIPTVLAATVADLWALQLSEPSATVWAAGAVAVIGVALAVVAASVRTGEDATAVGTLVAAPAPALVAAPLLERLGAGLLAGAVAVLLFAVWASARCVPALSQRLSRRMRVAAAAVGMVASLQATMTLVDQSTWATVLLCEALLLAIGALQLRNKAALVGATGYAAVGFVVAQFHEISPAVLVDGGHVGAAASGVTGVLAGLLVAVVAVALAAVGVRLAALRRLPGAYPLWTLVGVLLLYGTASATMALVLLVHTGRTAFLIGHMVITLSWVVFAIVLLLRGIRAPHLRIAGMVLIGVSLAKLFLFDLATLDGVVRVIAFLCAGLVLLAAGVRYARLVSADQRADQA